MVGNYDGTTVDMVPGFIRGFRAWRTRVMKSNMEALAGPPNVIYAAAFPTYWTPGVNQARCQHEGTYGPHQSPGEVCTHPWGGSPGCGFYGLHRPDDKSWGAAFSASSQDLLDQGNYVLGSFKATGKVILGTKGFRAQKVEIEALVSINRDHWDIADFYEVPLFKSLEGLVGMYPPIPVDELIGPVDEMDFGSFSNAAMTGGWCAPASPTTYNFQGAMTMAQWNQMMMGGNPPRPGGSNHWSAYQPPQMSVADWQKAVADLYRRSNLRNIEEE